MKNKLVISVLVCLGLLGLSISVSAQAQNLSDALAEGKALALGVGVSGQIEEVLVAPGDKVEKGQRLLSLNTERFQSKVDAAIVRLDFLKFKLQLAEEDYARQQELYEEGSLSTVELQMLEVNVKQAKSELADGRATYHGANRDLANAQIFAPVQGEIIAVPLVGQNVSVEGGVPVLINMHIQE